MPPTENQAANGEDKSQPKFMISSQKMIIFGHISKSNTNNIM